MPVLPLAFYIYYLLSEAVAGAGEELLEHSWRVLETVAIELWFVFRIHVRKQLEIKLETGCEDVYISVEGV